MTVNDNLISKLPICTSISCQFHKLGKIYMLLIYNFYNADKELFFLAYYVCETKT